MIRREESSTRAAAPSSMENKKEKPYEPAYKGFDAETTKRAQDTAERAREGATAKGEMADATYVEEGPKEAARRMGDSEKDVGDAVERARGRKR